MLKTGEGSFFLPFSMEKENQLLLQPIEVEFSLQVGVEFDNNLPMSHNRQYVPLRTVDIVIRTSPYLVSIIEVNV